MSSSNLSVGIVGLPNAGKSTLFNALLKKQAALAANYPFATIEPNVGIVPVPDPRLNTLVSIVKNETGVIPPIVPATIEFVDIAGLVAGAHKGEGLGNKFLSHIREVDIVVNVLRFFEDSDVIHTEGTVDPIRDKGIIETELILADLQTLEKQREPKGVTDKDAQKRWEIIQRLTIQLNNGKPAKEALSDVDEQALIADLHLLTMKPVLYACNVSEDTLMSVNGKLPETAQFSPHILVSAKIESELSNLPDEEQREYLQSLGLAESGLNQIIKTAYDMLGLISFLTAGEKEVRAWTIIKGTKAPRAAGTIHSDFEKKFIKADVMSFDDLVACGSRVKAKERGKLRIEGREYVMKDGDVVEFKIGS